VASTSTSALDLYSSTTLQVQVPIKYYISGINWSLVSGDGESSRGLVAFPAHAARLCCRERLQRSSFINIMCRVTGTIEIKMK